MQCPNRDGELSAHIRKLDNNLTISYSTCPACRGYWMESFAANFINLAPEDLEAEAGAAQKNSPEPACPICQKALVRETGENVPDAVTVYRCPEFHGYFFPTGQLAAFKTAQSAKLSYFKIWNIPLPGVGSVLLAGLLVLVLVGGGYFAFTNIQNQQVTTSKASQLLAGHREIIDANTKSTLIIATTSIDADVTLHVPAMNSLLQLMSSTDRRTHTYQLNNVAPGSHTYYFTIQTPGTAPFDSDIYDFTMPTQ